MAAEAFHVSDNIQSDFMLKIMPLIISRYYSRPLTVFNSGIPFAIKTPEQKLTPVSHKLNNHDYVFHIRANHGTLHVIAAMELIDKIHPIYDDVFDGHSTQVIGKLNKVFGVDVLDYVKAAALLHDSGREGDGVDRWDDISADNCMEFLSDVIPSDIQNRQLLIDLTASLIRFKEDKQANDLKDFLNSKNDIVIDDNFLQAAEHLRQMLNMADTIEVLRCRKEFDPNYMPIVKEIRKKKIVSDFSIEGEVSDFSVDENIAKVISTLVIPHRQLLLDEGRLTKTAKILHCDDRNWNPPQSIVGYIKRDTQKMGKAYCEKMLKYGFGILEIKTEDDVKRAVDLATTGTMNYIKDHKGTSGVKIFHSGFFSPSIHGDDEVKRAEFLLDKLQQGDPTWYKAIVVFMLLGKYNGQELQVSIQRSLGHTDVEMYKTDLKNYIKSSLATDMDKDQNSSDVIGRANAEIENIISEMRLYCSSKGTTQDAIVVFK